MSNNFNIDKSWQLNFSQRVKLVHVVFVYKNIRRILGDLHFQDCFEFRITDIKLIKFELFKCNILKEHLSIYIKANF